MLIFEINENDVLLGRGALTVNNEGNKRFRTIVEPWKAEYRGGNRKRKNEIAQIVVEQVFERNGRFLERVGDDELRIHGLPEYSRAWKVSDLNVTMEKAKQALRSKDPAPGQPIDDDPDRYHEGMAEAVIVKDAIKPAQQSLDAKLPASSIHTYQPKLENIDHQVTEQMQQTEARAQSPTTDLHEVHHPFLGTRVDEQEQIDHYLLHSEGGQRFRNVAAARPSPSPHDAVLLNELAHLQYRQQSMMAESASSAATIVNPSEKNNG